MTSILGELEELADEKHRAFNKNLIRSDKAILGVRTPQLRKTASRIMGGNWRSFIDEESSTVEEDIVTALVIANAEMSQSDRLALTKSFVPSIDNWAVCDVLCGDWKLSPDISKQLWEYCGELMDTGNEFEMRVGAVMMLSKFLDDEHIDGVLVRLSSHNNDGYYYKMGAAWALSYCYLEYQEKTEAVLETGRLNRKIQNLTVRKVRESLRADEAMRERVSRFRI